MSEKMENLLNLIEHSFVAYAYSYVYIDTLVMYDEPPEQYRSLINESHIYFIGETPRIKSLDAEQTGNKIRWHINLYQRDANKFVEFPIPEKSTLIKESDYFYVRLENGDKVWPNELCLQQMISDQIEPLTFKVIYVGQAYGENGKRNALERLKSHSTLQEIALKGVSEGKKLSLLLISLSDQSLITSFNPKALKTDDENDKSRIKSGVDKLFDTTEAEKVSLYEAAMIRYFAPVFNKQLKNSFPSTNLKILQDCYKKDIQAVVAEFCIDKFAFTLYSDAVEMQPNHIAYFDLHKDEDRRGFYEICRNDVDPEV